MSGFTFNRGFATIDAGHQDAVRPELDVRVSARSCGRNAAIEVRYVGNRGNNLWRIYNAERNEHHRERVPAGVQKRAAQPRDQPSQRPNGLREQRPARSGRAADLRDGVRRARIGAGVPSANGFTNADVHHAAAAGPGGTAGEYARRQQQFPTLRDGWQQAAGLRDAAATTRPVRIRSTSSRRIRIAAGNAVRLLTDEAAVEVRRAAAAVPPALRRRADDDGELHATARRAPTVTSSAPTASQDYHTLRDKSLDWGPTAYDLRHNFQTYGPTNCRSARTPLPDRQRRRSNRSFGGWSVSGIVRASRPAGRSC